MRIYPFIFCALLIVVFGTLPYCTGSDDEDEEELDSDDDDDDDTVESDSPCVDGELYESMQWLFDECFNILGYDDEPISADSACHIYWPEDVLCFIDCSYAFDDCADGGLADCLEACGLEMMK